MHASCPTTMEKQEAAISLKKIFHSERGDIDITLDFKGGPRIYFVPEVYEDLSDYIMDLLREIMAIQSESELSQPTKAYQQAVKSMQLRKNGFTDNSVTGSTANSKHQRKLLTDANKHSASYASTNQRDKANSVDTPELLFKLRASQPELCLIADPCLEQTWTIIVSCSIELDTSFIRSFKSAILIPTTEGISNKISNSSDSGKWEMTHQRVTFDRCRVMAKVANASDLKIDTNFDGTSNNDEPRPVVEALNRAQTNESVKSSTGESKSGSASRYRRRTTVPLQIVDNFKLHAEVWFKE